jgi:hypothetical protein
VGLLGLAVVACGLGPQAGEDDPSAAILFTAEVVTLTGAPVPGARYRLQVFDDPDAAFTQSEPPAIDDVYTAGADGTFVVHLEPSPRHEAFTRGHARPITFQVFVMAPDGELIFPFGFERDVGTDGWAGDPLLVTISPEPDLWVPRDRLLPPPVPAAT